MLSPNLAHPHNHIVHLLIMVDGTAEACFSWSGQIFGSGSGTKQYWFVRKSELRCMICEWGSPTLFLTLAGLFSIFFCFGYRKLHPLAGLTSLLPVSLRFTPKLLGCTLDGI